MNTSQGTPALSVMRKPGTHHVEMSTAVSAVSPKTELQGPCGASRKGGFAHFAVRRRYQTHLNERTVEPEARLYPTVDAPCSVLP